MKTNQARKWLERNAWAIARHKLEGAPVNAFMKTKVKCLCALGTDIRFLRFDHILEKGV